MKKLIIHSVLIITLYFNSINLFAQSSGNNSTKDHLADKNSKRSLVELRENLNIYIPKVIESHLRNWSGEKAITLISADLNKYMENLYKEGVFAGDLPDEAYMVRVGIGRTLKENKLYEVIVVEIGMAIDQPSLFKFISVTHQISSKKDNRIEIDPDNPPPFFLDYKC